MKTKYTFQIYQSMLPALEVALGMDPDCSLQVLGKTEDHGIEKLQVMIEAPGPRHLFELGFWTERNREALSKQHYDLADQTKLEVEVPAAFLLICKFYQVDPVATLALFAADLSQHPFITGGSDERDMAMSYFRRGHHAGDKEEKAEMLFGLLDLLRRSWQGNHKMKEYKKSYLQSLKEMDKEFNRPKNGKSGLASKG